jgi:hypothetical protein
LKPNSTAVAGENVKNVVWDITKLGDGLLDYNLNEGFKTDAIEIKCGEGWVNPERAVAARRELSFDQAFHFYVDYLH